MNHGDTETQRGRDALTEGVIGLVIDVHRALDPGLLESAHEECLCYELREAQSNFRQQVPLPVTYKSVKLDCGYRIDIVVEDKLVLELKTVEHLLPVHSAQLLTCSRPSGLPTGLLINFNSPVIKNGIRRFVL